MYVKHRQKIDFVDVNNVLLLCNILNTNIRIEDKIILEQMYLDPSQF